MKKVETGIGLVLSVGLGLSAAASDAHAQACDPNYYITEARIDWQIKGPAPDFTGDGYADYADWESDTGNFYVHANLRNGTFAGFGQNWATGTTCSGSDCDVMVADFTGDGKADYADHQVSTGYFYVHQNLANGTFAGFGQNWATGTTCTNCEVMVGDFTGDGKADYADHDLKSGTFYIHQNLGNGQFAGFGQNWGTGTACPAPTCAPGTFCDTTPTCQTVVADFTGDHYADYAEVNTSDGTLYVHQNLRNGTFAGWGQNWAVGHTCESSSCEVMVGDFTGDGMADFADHDVQSGSFYIHQNLGNGTFAGWGVNWGTGQTCDRENCAPIGYGPPVCISTIIK